MEGPWVVTGGQRNSGIMETAWVYECSMGLWRQRGIMNVVWDYGDSMGL
jgi:hypothetical protein